MKRWHPTIPRSRDARCRRHGVICRHRRDDAEPVPRRRHCAADRAPSAPMASTTRSSRRCDRSRPTCSQERFTRARGADLASAAAPGRPAGGLAVPCIPAVPGTLGGRSLRRPVHRGRVHRSPGRDRSTCARATLRDVRGSRAATSRIAPMRRVPASRSSWTACQRFLQVMDRDVILARSDVATDERGTAAACARPYLEDGCNFDVDLPLRGARVPSSAASSPWT